MKLKSTANDKDKVGVFIEQLSHPFKNEMEAVRAIIIAAGPQLNERIKWNSPSFYYNKTDFSAFNFHQQSFLQLILLFPNGVVPDPSAIMEGDWKDRRQVKFHTMDDVKKKKNALEGIVKDWVRLQNGSCAS